MTEPVAYMLSDFVGNDFTSLELPKNPNNPRGLYFKEQLHPRVKMTKKQHKQFENYKTNKNDFYNFWQSLLVDDVSLFKEISERDLMLAWLDDRTIEIVPDMKWFVRSKERNSEKNYYYFVGKRPTDYWPHYGYKRAAKKFDTKEEAEKWTNPLTEAVQLPVEGE
ncbi:hypothetical protein [Leuconostoc mesenteroides]|uniref:hypothetical protein n=1 Tax=Leuconostoc mesenteroides TaxID=1245 RepID=UPI00235E652B|nr:hypothetical protein [Leuconostoc mesenteroides]